jgi:hypothetical protein
MKLELQLAVWLEFLRNSDDEVRRLVQQEALLSADLETIAVEELAGADPADSS